MWERIRVIFTIPELRQKIFLTLFLLAIYRVGSWIQLPVIDQEAINAAADKAASGGFSRFVEYAAVFSASRLSQVTIFGLGIMPYISASIIFQLLGSVWKPLEDLQKEGESGRKKINEYTRYATVVLCLIQSAAYVRLYVMGQGLAHESFTSAATGNLTLGWQITSVLMMTCGTVFLMWLGEQIDEFGIGNGISLLIMAGILAQMPAAGVELINSARMELVGLFNGEIGIEALLVLAVLFVLVVVGVVFITLGQRRIPTQSAKHVRGRRVYGGSRQYLPMRINQAGVMPIIFAGSLLMFPQIIFTSLGQWMVGTKVGEWLSGMADVFGSPTSLVYNLLYVVMIYFFCYFWTAIMFNPKDMADNLKTMGTFIPGYRPGKRTGDYLEQVMVRITYVGAGFLALVAIIPSMIAGSLGVSFMVASFYGGTGLLIAVSVAFDLVQKIDSHLVMRNYSGLLES